MKPVLVGVILLLVCFIIPLHVYSIGTGQGIGIQGSFYRYQETEYGPMIITLTKDISYVTSGIYTGRTALSIGLWLAGTISLVIATLLYLIRPDFSHPYFPQLSGFLLIGAGVFYIASCIAQFGLLLNGGAGMSMPYGGFFLMVLGIGLVIFPSFFISVESEETEHII